MLLIAGLLSVTTPVYAYLEYPPFEQTQFADSTGMFRWWESCWWRVVDPYVYLRCQANGDILIVRPDGTVSQATQSELDRLFDAAGGAVSFNAPGTSGSRLGISRFFSGRTSAAPGDGIRLSDYYGGSFWRFDGSGTTGVFNEFDASAFGGLSGLNGIGDNEYGVIRFNADGSRDTSDATFRFSGDNSGPQRIFGEEVPTSDGAGDTGAFSGGDGFFSENNLRTRMHDFFYEPLGLVGCDSIHDYRDGGIFGPIPCTSYPGVFGPVPEY